MYHPPASSPCSSRDTFPLHMFSWLGVDHGHKHWSGWEICHGICSLNNTRENRLASRPALNSKSNGLSESSNLGFHYWPFSCYLSHLFPLLTPAILLWGYLFFPLLLLIFEACLLFLYFSPHLALLIVFILNPQFPQCQKKLYLNTCFCSFFLHFHHVPRKGVLLLCCAISLEMQGTSL